MLLLLLVAKRCTEVESSLLGGCREPHTDTSALVLSLIPISGSKKFTWLGVGSKHPCTGILELLSQASSCSRKAKGVSLILVLILSRCGTAPGHKVETLILLLPLTRVHSGGEIEHRLLFRSCVEHTWLRLLLVLKVQPG